MKFRDLNLIFVLLLLLVFTACSYRTDIPLEYPTPPSPSVPTPLPTIELKRDAELEKRFADIAKDAKGKVGVAAVVLETGEAAMLNEIGRASCRERVEGWGVAGVVCRQDCDSRTG